MCLAANDEALPKDSAPEYMGVEKDWEQILADEGLSMNRGKSRWLVLTNNTDGYQYGRDAVACTLDKADKRPRKTHKPHKSHKPLHPQTRQCVVCQKEFTGYHSDSSYCSRACVQKAYRQRYRKNSNTTVRGF